MIVDLTIRPEDWLLAVWWNTIPAGKIDLFPRGGHRLATVRRVHPGAAGHLPVWMIEDCGRRADGSGEWHKGSAFKSGDASELVTELSNRQRYYAGHLGAENCGRVLVAGGGGGFLFALRNSKPLPDWLSVLVIEHKPASVPEPS